MRKLISFVGAGRQTDKGEPAGRYDTVQYYLDTPETFVETDIIVDALVEFSNETYDEVHLFGTTGSMWDTFHQALYEDKYDNTSVFAELESLILGKESGNLREDNSGLQQVMRGLSDRWSAEVYTHIVNMGGTQDELWGLLRRLLGVIGEDDKISVDITHSFRHIPLVVLMALRFMTVIHEESELEHLFYGASAASDASLKPVYNLVPLMEMFDWIDATAHFQESGDGESLAKLLNKEQEPALQSIAGKLYDLSQRMQYDKFTGIHEKYSNLFTNVRKVQANQGSAPAQAVLPALEKNLRGFSGFDGDWKVLLSLARRHFTHGRKAESILIGFEAVYVGIGQQLGFKTPLSKTENKRIRNSYPLWEKAKDEDLRSTTTLFMELKEYRNAIAHPDNPDTRKSDLPELGELDKHIPKLLDQLETALDSGVFDGAPVGTPE